MVCRCQVQRRTSGGEDRQQQLLLWLIWLPILALMLLLLCWSRTDGLF
jgi:hypothetical protein